MVNELTHNKMCRFYEVPIWNRRQIKNLKSHIVISEERIK